MKVKGYALSGKSADPARQYSFRALLPCNDTGVKTRTDSLVLPDLEDVPLLIQYTFHAFTHAFFSYRVWRRDLEGDHCSGWDLPNKDDAFECPLPFITGESLALPNLVTHTVPITLKELEDVPLLIQYQFDVLTRAMFGYRIWRSDLDDEAIFPAWKLPDCGYEHLAFDELIDEINAASLERYMQTRYPF
jgi:hypothetical protein